MASGLAPTGEGLALAPLVASTVFVALHTQRGGHSANNGS